MNENRLIHEKSPYLLQHAGNPVDWHPWGDAAFEKAKQEDKPVFLSVGYATCHWCHVMERESFEDEAAARLLNDTFVCIKVDREERPDIDTVYMTACQMMTGSGGWPLTIFMTPDKQPFFAGTYIPRRNRFGRPGLIELCTQVKQLWASQREKLLETAGTVSGHLSGAFRYEGTGEIGADMLESAFTQIRGSFDGQHGGFGRPPKFPTPHKLLFLLRYHHHTRDDESLGMVEKTLTAMRLGGMWDHIGFGFHRYSTDAQWLLPHFEKMLYDQALLAMAYLETHQITRDPFHARTAEEIFTYVLRDMTDPAGPFYAAEDADSEGEEGKFYVWTLEEFREVLGEETAKRWTPVLNLTSEGNFTDEATGKRTGASIPHLSKPLDRWAEDLDTDPVALRSEWATVRETLFGRRKKRIHPLKDDKVLTDWNGLMIAALAMGARILGRPEWADAAKNAARFILTNLKDEDDGLLHRYRGGTAGIRGHADDYAFLIRGLLELYRTTFDPGFARQAASLQKRMVEDFWDHRNGGFFLTEQGSSELPVRPKEIYDGASPSANSVALLNLLHLGRLTGESRWEERAAALSRTFADNVRRQPSAFTYFLLGVDFSLAPSQEVVIASGADPNTALSMASALDADFSPHRVVLFKSPENAGQLSEFAPFTAGLDPVDDRAAAYICKDFACGRPATTTAQMVETLKTL